MSNTSWLMPFLMLVVAPALTGAARPRTSASLGWLLAADVIAIGIVVGIHASAPDALYWIWIFYATALVALLLTGSLLGGALRFGVARLARARE
jgi:hypothetical protein